MGRPGDQYLLAGRGTAKISALSSGNIDKYEYVTGEEKFPSNQRQIIEQAKFTYCPLRKGFEKQTKTIEDQGKKQIKELEEHGKQLIKSNGRKYYLELLKQKTFLKQKKFFSPGRYLKILSDRPGDIPI